MYSNRNAFIILCGNALIVAEGELQPAEVADSIPIEMNSRKLDIFMRKATHYRSRLSPKASIRFAKY